MRRYMAMLPLVLMVTLMARAIPPAAPGGEGELTEPPDIRVFEVGQSYRLTYSTNMVIPAMGAGRETLMTLHLGLEVAAGQHDGAAVVNMTLDRIMFTESMDGAEQTSDSADPGSAVGIQEMVGMSFVGDVGPDGQIVSLAATEESLQALQQRADMLNLLVASLEKMLADCMYYAPGVGLGQGDTWDLAREMTPGLENYVLMMMASGQVPVAEEATCVLESIGGDGTPTVVTFTGTQQLIAPAEGIPFDVSQLVLAVTGRAEFDATGEIPLRILRWTTMTLPAEMTLEEAMNITTTERITLTPPGVDAPAPPDDEEEGLPEPPGADGRADPTTQPATQPAEEGPGNIQPGPTNPPEPGRQGPMAPLPPDAAADEPTTQPTD